MSIDQLATKFVSLAAKSTLTKADHGEAQKLMRQLKEAGMSNEEISKLSNGKWSVPTVKGYTKGIKPKNLNPWQDAVGLLGHLINAGVTLDEVGLAVAVFKDLESAEVDLSEVVEFLGATASASLDVKTMINHHETLKASGISVKDVGEILVLKQKLEQNGLGLDSLTALVKVAEKYGHPQKIIEAVLEYGSLAELKKEKAAVNMVLESKNQELASVQQQLQQVEAQLAQSKKPLEAYENVVKLGFSEVELRELSNLTKKYGGVKRAFEAIKAYADYTEICNEISRVQATLTETKARIARLEEQHAHLKTAIEMCDNLVRTYKFGLDAIATIFSVAQKFGEPINVLKAIEAYGKLLAIQQELVKLEAREAQHNKLLVEAEGKYQEALNHLESLNAQALKTGQDVGRLQAEFKHSRDLERILNLINDPESASYEEYGPLVLATAVSLRKFVLIHEQRFKFPGGIRSGLDGLIKDLGGK